jgi:predicted nucleic-acid-binding Zn-ribbon protein
MTNIEKQARQLARTVGIKFRNTGDGIEARHKSGQRWFFFWDWNAAYEWISGLDTSTLEPDRYECKRCNWRGYEGKKIKLPGITFLACPKCGGSMRETQEWLDWMDRQRERVRQHAIKHNNGYLFGVDVATKEEREKLNSGGNE